MQGLWMEGRRPKSKAELKRFLAEGGDPHKIRVEATSMFSDEYDGPLSNAPEGRISFVGPDPHTKRSFYGTITVGPEGKVTIK